MSTALVFTKWMLGGLAVVGAFLLTQDGVTLDPIAKVGIGAFLAFAAYVNPATVADKLRDTATAR